MRIIFFFEGSIHYGMAAANRISNYVRGLQENGCDVEVVMPFAFISDSTKPFTAVGELDGVKYKYLGFLPFHPKHKYPYPLSGIVLLGTKWLGYLKTLLFRITEKRKYQSIYIYKFSTFFTFLLLVLNSGKISVSELCEIPYFALHGFKKKFKRFIREKTIFKIFGGFIVISENLQEYINIHKSKKAKVIKVPILVNDSAFSSDKQVNEIIKELNEPYIIHNGDITYESKDGIAEMIKAFGEAQKILSFPVKFIITSRLELSPVQSEIKRYIKENDLEDKILFTGFLTKEEITILQKNASLGILNKLPNEQNYFCFPTKLGEYLLNGVAVIATSVGEMNNYLIDGTNAYIVSPLDTKLITVKIVEAFTNESERATIASNGKSLAEKEFSYAFHGKRLKIFFDSMLKKND